MRPAAWLLLWVLIIVWHVHVVLTSPPAPVSLIIVAVYAAWLPRLWPTRAVTASAPVIVTPRRPLAVRLVESRIGQAVRAGAPLTWAQWSALLALARDVPPA